MEQQVRVSMDEPEQFHYANAFRMYGTPNEIVVEFARSRPQQPGEVSSVSAKGLVGVVMSMGAAKGFLAQLQETIASSESATPTVVKVSASGAIQSSQE